MVSSVSIQERKEKELYDSLPKIKINNKDSIKNIENELTKVSYNVQYDGELKPEIRLRNRMYSNNEDDSYIYQAKYKKELKIIVDTTQLIFKEALNYSGFRFARAHPVFMLNETDTDLSIGFGSLIYMILEAKNENGEWKPIERQDYYFCGAGIYNYILKKDKLCVTSVYKYSGSFKTKLRLKHLENYSNEFNGYINPNKFGEPDKR